MNTKNQKPHRTPIYRRPAVILTFLALLIVVAVAVFFVVKALTSQPESDQRPSEDTSLSEEEDDSDLPVSGDTPATSDAEESDDWEPKIKQYEGEDSNKAEELSGVINYVDVDDNRNVTIYSSINQLVDGGTCTLNLKKGNNVVFSTKVATRIEVATSACEPIVFSATQIPSGTYEIELQILGGNKKGIINSEVNL